MSHPFPLPRLAALALLGLLASLPRTGGAQTSETLAGTAHDFSDVAGSVEASCDWCHLPFATSGNKGGADEMEVYASILTVDGSGGMGMETALCLSCHDGTNAPSVGSADQSHPSSVVYDPSVSPGLRPAAEVEAMGVHLAQEGGERRVECTSCHTAHDDSNGSFLRVSNQGSALCLTCHVK